MNLPAQRQCCWFQAERANRLMDSSSPSISLFTKHINFVIWSIKEGRKQALSKWTHSRKINDPHPARWDPVHLKSIYYTDGKSVCLSLAAALAGGSVTSVLTFQACVTSKNTAPPVSCRHCRQLFLFNLRASKTTVGLSEDETEKSNPRIIFHHGSL